MPGKQASSNIRSSFKHQHAQVCMDCIGQEVLWLERSSEEKTELNSNNIFPLICLVFQLSSTLCGFKKKKGGWGRGKIKGKGKGRKKNQSWATNTGIRTGQVTFLLHVGNMPEIVNKLMPNIIVRL